ncbi:MAG: rhodanese-like domain-containing protein [Gammaproteobacteria bacterium]|nr:rhodanese-like domain-containing protein [Gammaproteobacteria bacterium]
MKTFIQLVDDLRAHVGEIFPWDLQKLLEQPLPPLLLDVREPDEFASAHIAGSINVPRGILETACEFGYAETVPELARARTRPVVVICRSGNRSVMAAYTMKLLGFEQAVSLKTGVKGWNDFDLALVNAQDIIVDPDSAEVLLAPALRAEQLI